MKIRIKGDSVRFRLTQSEVSQLNSRGQVVEKTHFPFDSVFQYVIRMSYDSTASASFLSGVIEVYLPANIVHDWATTDEVSITEFIQVDDGRTLSLLVEKDFKCLVNRPGEEDMFPHPNEGVQKC